MTNSYFIVHHEGVKFAIIILILSLLSLMKRMSLKKIDFQLTPLILLFPVNS